MSGAEEAEAIRLLALAKRERLKAGRQPVYEWEWQRPRPPPPSRAHPV